MSRLRFFLLWVALAAAACSGSTPASLPSSPPAPSIPATPASPAPPPHWVAIAASPIPGRISEGSVWTGSEMIVWGGVSRTGDNAQQVGDGAAYDPATDSWHTLAAAPSGLKGGGGQAAAWTGDHAVFWVGNSPEGPVGGAVYDPSADSWRTLPDGPLGVREGYVSVWTGHRLLIIGGVAGDQIASPVAAGLDPVTGSWRPLRALNRLTGLLPVGAVWDGTKVFLFGNLSLCPELGSGCQKYRHIFLTYTPSTDTVHEISLKDAPVNGQRLSRLVPAAWTGTEVLFTTALDTRAAPVMYDPAADTWRVGAHTPCAVTGQTAGQTAWVGSLLVAPCGKAKLQLYDPAADTWQILAAGPSPLNSRDSSAVVWTGTQLIAWSGSLRSSGNPTPGSGAAIDLSSVMSSSG